MPDDHDPLRPVRLRPPRPRALLRYAAVAALLLLAAGVLFAGQSDASGCRSAAPRGPAQSEPAAGDRRVAGPRSPHATTTEEPTDVHSPLPVPSGMTGVPVQLAEPSTALVLRPGDRVDVIARASRPGGASPSATAEDDPQRVVLARDVLVLSVNPHRDRSLDGGIVYLAMTKDEAQDVAKTAPDVAIGITVRPR